MILLKLEFEEKRKCQTFQKFNASILKDKDYLDVINEEIKKVKEENAVTSYSRDNLDNIPLSEL